MKIPSRKITTFRGPPKTASKMIRLLLIGNIML